MTSVAEDSSDRMLLERGVYTLANDVVIEWFQAFVRSFRRSNPTLPLTVIPYDKSISQLQGLTKEYQFTIMEESECSRFNALEAVVMDQNQKAAMFRKWACFYGSYADFIFLDSDIIVTSSFDEILDAFSAASYDFLYFDVNFTVVYTPEGALEMAAKYGSVGFNAGAFISRKGIIGYNELLAISQKAAGDRDKFILEQGDQPFLNYAFDITRRRTARINQVLPKFASYAWARQPFTYDWKTNTAIDGEGKIMPFIHWAGCVYPTMVRPEVFLMHRTNGLALPARIRYDVGFYFFRYRAYLLKAQSYWRKVIFQFLTSNAWRKFYLCKLIGIKIKLPI
jgi:hypothetical protein